MWTGYTGLKGTIGRNGCVAKIYYRYEGSESHSDLGSNPEQACHESDLPPNILSFHSLNLSFPDHIHCLIALDCPTRCVETGKPEPGIDSSFNEPMVLLDDIIEIFALSELRGHGEHAFLLQLLDGRWIGVAPIDVDDPRRLMLGSLQHLAEEPFGGSRAPFGAEHEVDRLALGIDSAIEVIPFPF